MSTPHGVSIILPYVPPRPLSFPQRFSSTGCNPDNPREPTLLPTIPREDNRKDNLRIRVSVGDSKIVRVGLTEVSFDHPLVQKDRHVDLARVIGLEKLMNVIFFSESGSMQIARGVFDDFRIPLGGSGLWVSDQRRFDD